MKEGLVTISSFLRSINLEMSVSKTKYILFETKNSSRDGYFSEIAFAGGVVERVNNFKYLGLLIDSKLLWEDHVDKTLKEIAPFVGILRKIRYFVDKKVLTNIYYAHIHSRLCYCLPIWSACSIDRKMRLQRLQNKAVKFMQFKPHLTPTSELYNDKIISFMQLCSYESILFVHKIVSGGVRCDFIPVTSHSVSGRLTRQSSSYRPPNFNMAIGQNSLFYSGINLYNDFCNQKSISISSAISTVKIQAREFVRAHKNYK